jgi:hypothetical protein
MPIVIQSISPKQFFLFFDVFTFRLRPFFSPLKYGLTNSCLSWILTYPKLSNIHNLGLEYPLQLLLMSANSSEAINSHLYNSTLEYEIELFGTYSKDLTKLKENAHTAFD